MARAGWFWMRKLAGPVLAASAAGMLAGCSTMGDSTGAMAMLPPPEQAMPVETSTVASNNLPPIGTDGSVQVAPNEQGPWADSTYAGGTDPMRTASSGAPAGTGNGGYAPYDGSFVSLDDINSDLTGTGRDLSGGLTVEKLLGGWTVTSGTTTCRLNLTYSQKAGTDRYRASAPNCAIPALGSVASWQLVGGQIQLFNEGGGQIANLLQSGGRFIGALAGGQGLSMAG